LDYFLSGSQLGLTALQKQYLNAYSKILADETGPHGVRVATVSPGLKKKRGNGNLLELTDRRSENYS
jgi:NAD(P)-dependent dehydrogenase (short-subunit alcohol dehydrogenase family)